jgi:N-acetylglutamate synthase-like GNAT family acetyltransferase
MSDLTIESAASPEDTEELDELLWRVLWQPLGLPRNVRQEFKVDGESLELVARENGRVTGGVVAVWTGETEVELRHVAVVPEAQNRGTGRRLVERVVDIVRSRGCQRIHTISRNTSVGFFRTLGFKTASGTAPEHPVLRKHGIVFELMDRTVEPHVAGHRADATGGR